MRGPCGQIFRLEPCGFQSEDLLWYEIDKPVPKGSHVTHILAGSPSRTSRNFLIGGKQAVPEYLADLTSKVATQLCVIHNTVLGPLSGLPTARQLISLGEVIVQCSHCGHLHCFPGNNSPIKLKSCLSCRASQTIGPGKQSPEHTTVG